MPRRLLSLLPGFGTPAFNAVGPLLEDGDAEDGFEAFHRRVEHDVEALCGAGGITHRLFRTSLVVGDSPPVRGPDREGFLQFLEALHGLKRELEERLPQYFEYKALACQAPAGASLDIIRVEQAAEHLLRLARAPDTASGRFHVIAPERVPFVELCERVGTAYGLSLLVVEDREALNAIDRSFHERLGGFHDWLASSGVSVPENPPAEALPFDAEAQEPLFEAILQGQDAARDDLRAQASGVVASLDRRTLDRGGASLTYYAGGGGGTPLVILNALGQGLHYWSRLLVGLMRRHRVILWEPRGLEEGSPPILLQDQVEDAEAILRNEGIEQCHLVGWCTGPKVALELYLRHPSRVASMVFLNGTFKCVGSPAELDTAYERNFEPLSRMLERRPALAASVLGSLRSSVADDAFDLTEDDETDADALATRVLALMNRDLRSHVLAPFRSESSLINHLRQIRDFWTYDSRKSAGQVRVPVLLLSAEYDAVASPGMSQLLAGLLPRARHVHVPDATHYCLYDRPEFVADQLESFFTAASS
ncbi:alpha/beta fold hydrolase [Corallococcus sp. CA053C]|nr:alpha/beta fold hydrolase [Corallococcus sp. CA053C]